MHNITLGKDKDWVFKISINLSSDQLHDMCGAVFSCFAIIGHYCAVRGSLKSASDNSCFFLAFGWLMGVDFKMVIVIYAATAVEKCFSLSGKKKEHLGHSSSCHSK